MEKDSGVEIAKAALPVSLRSHPVPNRRKADVGTLSKALL